MIIRLDQDCLIAALIASQPSTKVSVLSSTLIVI